MIGDIAILANLVIHAWFIIRKDQQLRIIPNRMLASLLFFHLALITIVEQSKAVDSLTRCGIVLGVVYIFYFLLTVLSKGRFGMGDAKALAVTACITVQFSISLVPAHLVLTHIIGFALGVYSLVRKQIAPLAYAVPIFTSSIVISIYAIVINSQGLL